MIRSPARIHKELTQAKVAMRNHPVGSRMHRMLEARVKQLSVELSLACGALSLGAL